MDVSSSPSLFLSEISKNIFMKNYARKGPTFLKWPGPHAPGPVFLSEYRLKSPTLPPSPTTPPRTQRFELLPQGKLFSFNSPPASPGTWLPLTLPPLVWPSCVRHLSDGVFVSAWSSLGFSQIPLASHFLCPHRACSHFFVGVRFPQALVV